MVSKKSDLEIFIHNLTQQPGVYRMLDDAGKILYIGKARNLKKRVSSYFIKTAVSVKTRVMLAKIHSIEVTVTHTEKEALLLENNQIKQFQPRYNILFRDSKSYPYICFSPEHDFPRFSYYRGAKRKSDRYFGPYPSAGAVRNTLNLIKSLFAVRQCTDRFFRNRTRPCLEYQIKRCSAPCVGLISPVDYAEDVQHTIMFLRGEGAQVIDSLIKPMQQAADALEYERAARYRDQISNVRKLQESQYMSTGKGSIDIIATSVQAGIACVQVFFIRNGLHQGSHTYFPKNYLYAQNFLMPTAVESAIIESFIAQFYLQEQSQKDIPKEILLSHIPHNKTLLEATIATKSKHKVRIKNDCRGDRAKWLEMAQENVLLSLAQYLRKNANQKQRMKVLQEVLHLDKLPQRMECFDISHTGGSEAVAACVVFENGHPLKAEYRQFNMQNIQAGDDYAAIEQAVMRRYMRVKKERGKVPDIIFIDGGLGQVKKARKVLDELQLKTAILIGVAKGVSRKPGLETLYIDRDSKRMHLPEDSLGLHLIQYIRDEAHRFAVSSHRNKRKKVHGNSLLENIEGIGKKRRQNLLKHFGGLHGISSAGVEDLIKVAGIKKYLAHKIYNTFHGVS